MNRRFFLLAIFTLLSKSAMAVVEAPVHLMVAPGTISATTATLVWDKPEHYNNIVRYHIMVNGKDVATAEHCNYLLTGLSQDADYKCAIVAEDKEGKLSSPGNVVYITTSPRGRVVNVTDFGAKGDGTTINTQAIQKAIDACPSGGTVLIPKGVFLSGALFLKGYMTLQIEKDGVLKGSGNEADYRPFYRNRFEGWEMDTYASLLNAGTMNNKGGYTVEQLSIKGEGTISGAGGTLGKAMIAKDGMRSRGRLICLMNCKNVEIQGLQIENAPCWTIHYIYCKGVTCHDLKIVSTARNGDGLDPDSSEDSYILNCSFSTGDDCIAIKSGKNPEGFTIGKPTKNVRIDNCVFTKGHGISIGSEMSGGVSDVLVQDCKAGALLHGMQIKGTKDRGGYVKNVTVADCQLLKITIFSSVNYNNDGAPAPELPVFQNFVFRNVDLSGAAANEVVIDINGYKDPAHKLKNVVFSNVVVPANAIVSVNDAEQVKFTDVRSSSGEKPLYRVVGSTDIVY